SYVVRNPPGWLSDTTPRPATTPANTTVPAPAASTGSPAAAARSTPRCPGPYRSAGGWKPRTTAGDPDSGQPNRRPGGWPASSGPARANKSTGNGGAGRAAMDADPAASVDSAAARRKQTRS